MLKTEFMTHVAQRFELPRPRKLPICRVGHGVRSSWRRLRLTHRRPPITSFVVKLTAKRYSVDRLASVLGVIPSVDVHAALPRALVELSA